MKSDNNINLCLWFTKSLRDGEFVNNLVQVILNNKDFKYSNWFNENITGQRNKKIDDITFSQLVNSLLFDEVIYIVLSNEKSKNEDYEFNISITNVNLFGKINCISMNVFHNYLNSIDRITKLLNYFKSIIKYTNPLYGYIHDSKNLLIKSGYSGFKITEKIPCSYWGNYFGEEWTEKIGKQKLLALESYSIEKIESGIYIQLSENPLVISSKEYESNEKKLNKILGIKKKYIIF